jgi:serine/threonine-protein kinase
VRLVEIRPRCVTLVEVLGTTLDGRYFLEEKIGAGGMGTVYRAIHTGLQRPFAVKVLEARADRDPAFVEQFRREAFASGQLDHPNIVAVSDFGTLGNGTLFLAMELLEGESLRARINRAPLAWADAIDVMRGVLAGLAYAHERAIIHCDIKPDNIYLAHKHGEVFVKVLDFGLAKLLTQAAGEGLAHGTPDYVSPEQALGAPITPSADLYSASVVLYEMLTGRPPFGRLAREAKIRAHIHTPPPPFERLLEIPARLEEVVLAGLAKFPAERYASAREYVRVLDGILVASGLDVPPTVQSPFAIPTPAPGSLRMGTAPPVGESELSVRPRAMTERPRDPLTTLVTKPSRYRPRLALAAAVAALGLAGATTCAVWPHASAVARVAAPPIGNVAPTPSARSPSERAPTAPTGGDVLQLIADAERAHPGAPRETQLRGDGVAALRTVAQRLWDHGKLDSARAIYSELARLAPDDAVARERAVKPAPTAHAPQKAQDAGRIQWLVAQVDLAILDRRFVAPAGRNALEYLLELRKLDPRNGAVLERSTEVAAVLTSEATVHPAEANQLLSAARRARGEDVRPAESPHRAEAKMWLAKGRSSLATGDYAAASAAFQKAIGADPSNHGAYAGLAEVAFNRADFTRALLAAKRAVELAPTVVAYRMMLAKSYYKVMRFDDAIEQWQRALQLEPTNQLARQNIDIARAKRGA